MTIKDWPKALENAGLKVQKHNNFDGQALANPCINPQRVFWHHDASPAGSSPGALDWMINSYNAKSPSAQIWVDYTGTWHFVGAGYASHAGVTRGPWISSNSVGVETDHTINETMNPDLLNSMRAGFAAICRAEGKTSEFVTFHKIEASPRGRKTDPYFSNTDPYDSSKWDQQLANEQAIIQNIINGGASKPTNVTKEWDEMASKEDIRAVVREELAAFGANPNYSIKDARTLLATDIGNGQSLGAVLAEISGKLNK
jgi:hypothetical protein